MERIVAACTFASWVAEALVRAPSSARSRYLRTKVCTQGRLVQSLAYLHSGKTVS